MRNVLRVFKDENSQSDIKAQADERGMKLTQDRKFLCVTALHTFTLRRTNYSKTQLLPINARNSGSRFHGMLSVVVKIDKE